jgi:hypothetical protein
LRTPAGWRFGRFRLLLRPAEPFDQDAAPLAVGHQAGPFVGPFLVCNLQVVPAGAAIGAMQRGIVLTPGMAAARAAVRFFRLLIPFAERARPARHGGGTPPLPAVGFAKRPVILAVANRSARAAAVVA